MVPNFGTTLKTMRGDLGLSQLSLAHKIDTTQRHISFLETGRSGPTRDFVIRLATGLALSMPQRAALFEAGGFQNPFKQKNFESEDLEAVLDTIERRILSHWPFPGFVLNEDWQILRTNAAGEALITPFLPEGETIPTMFSFFLSKSLRERIVNWPAVAEMLYYRLQISALSSPDLAKTLADARADGTFDAVPQTLQGTEEPQPFVPAILRGPGGQLMSISSFAGNLMTVHEAAIAGLEIELMFPVDDMTESVLLGRSS